MAAARTPIVPAAPRTVLGIAVAGAEPVPIPGPGWLALNRRDDAIVATPARSATAAACLVRPFPLPNGRDALLVCSDQIIRLNGRPVPKLAIVARGDSVVIGSLPEFRLVERTGAVLRDADAATDTQDCPLCRSLLTGRLLVCPCGCALHAHVDGPDALACASVAAHCPACGGSLATDSGWQPPLGDGS